MDYTWMRTHMQLLVTDTLKKRWGRGSENLSVSGVTTICLMQHNTSPSHRVDQAVDCGLWNVVPLLFNGCVKLLDIGGNWNILLYTLIQSIPNMLNGWHVWWVCKPWKNWNIFSFQELCTDPCDTGLCIFMLKHEVMAAEEWHDNGPQAMFPKKHSDAEQISGLLSANLKVVKILCNFQHTFTVNTEAVPALSLF